MINQSDIVNTIKHIVSMLVNKQYSLIYNLDYGNDKLTPNTIQEAIESYFSGKITMPPDNAFISFDSYETTSPEEVLVEFDLWYSGSRSDLTLSFHLYQLPSGIRYSIDDIHIL